LRYIGSEAIRRAIVAAKPGPAPGSDTVAYRTRGRDQAVQVSVGTAFVPLHVPVKPNMVVPFAGTEPL